MIDGVVAPASRVLASVPEYADHVDRFLEHGEALGRARPAAAGDVLVQILAAADAEEEAPGHQHGCRRRRLRDDRGVHPYRRRGHARPDLELVRRDGDRAEHAPHERALTLLPGP